MCIFNIAVNIMIVTWNDLIFYFKDFIFQTEWLKIFLNYTNI